MMKLTILLFNLLLSTIFISNDVFYINQKGVSTKQNQEIILGNRTYKEGIESVLIHKKGWELSFPVIELNNEGEKILLSFDELGTKINDYSWQIVYCNANWTQSELEPIDYLSGFFEGHVQDYDLSKNTTTNYINYRIEFPNDDISFYKSGNYIIKIVESDNPSQIILTQRFYVIDKKIAISGNIFRQPFLSNSNNQRVNFTITYNNEIIDPYSNLITNIIKNGESDICTKGVSPSKISMNNIGYNNINELSFAGGNEYRHFDIKSLKFLSDNLEYINYTDNTYQVILRTVEPQASEVYNFKNDLNGQRLIKLENSYKSNIEADYCKVKFRLKAPINLNKGNYYVFGALSNWQTSDKYKMSFDELNQEYTLTLLLKQGYYNYHFVFKSDGLRIDETSQWYSVEGNYYQTENDYYVLTYYKNPTEISEELVGFAKINSNTKP